MGYFLSESLRPLFAERKVGGNKSVLYPPILTPPHLPTFLLNLFGESGLALRNWGWHPLKTPIIYCIKENPVLKWEQAPFF